jgi:hypothetical protein
MYYPVQTTIAPLITIRRERLLPVRGQVLVRPGEVVGPADVVARCQVPGEIRVVDVGRALKIRRERVDRYLRKAVDDPVQAGEVLAAPRGLLGRLRSCRAPVDGQVLAARNGLILIEGMPVDFELRAHMKGQITNIMPDRGVVISTVGTLIQGVWGSGGEAEGVLKMLVDSPQKPLRARSIDVSCHGTLVVGGRILDEQTFEQAIEAKVRGIIAGSANADLRPALEALPFPVMLSEGFGTLPMSQHVFSLLNSNMGREAILNADTQTRWDVKRPEVIIPLRSEEEKTPEEHGPMPLEVGMHVRVARAPHRGAFGTVTRLPALPQTVESGARLPVAEVDLEDEGPVLIPLANLEFIR